MKKNNKLDESSSSLFDEIKNNATPVSKDEEQVIFADPGDFMADNYEQEAKEEENKEEDLLKNANKGPISYIEEQIQQFFPNTFCTNSMNGKRWMKKAPRWYDGNPEKWAGKEFTDLDRAELLRWLQDNTRDKKLQNLSKNFTMALTTIFAKNQYNPIESYLNELKWDGKERLKYVLRDIFNQDISSVLEEEKEEKEEKETKNRKKKNANLLEEVSAKDLEYDYEFIKTKISIECIKKFFIAGVKRIFEPGCEFQYMLVLVGPQGCGKSTFLKKLVKEPNWFTSNIKVNEGFSSAKLDVEQLEGKWVCEFAELSGLSKDFGKVKNFVSRTEDESRKAWGRNLETIPRKQVFAGTTNNYRFLKDPTGNRRFWPIFLKTSEEITATDIAENVNKVMTSRYRNQLWAEAVHIYKNNNDYPLYFKKDFEKILNQTREDFTENKKEEEFTTALNKSINTLIDEKRKDHCVKFSYQDIIDTLKKHGYMDIDSSKPSKDKIRESLDTLYPNIGTCKINSNTRGFIMKLD